MRNRSLLFLLNGWIVLSINGDLSERLSSLVVMRSSFKRHNFCCGFSLDVPALQYSLTQAALTLDFESTETVTVRSSIRAIFTLKLFGIVGYKEI